MSDLPDNALDHIVWVTDDIAATAAEVAAATGVTPSAGGPHVGLGTHNVLCSLGAGQYLEIIGRDPSQPEPESPRPFGIDALKGSGIAGWCVRHDDLAAMAASGSALGLSFVGPIAMSREAPGGLLSWELLLLDGDTNSGLLPFFIDWGASAHPSASAAAGLHLRALVGNHTEPQRVLRTLLALDVTLEVRPGDGAGLTAVLEGPGGSLTVPPASFGSDGVLRGYRDRIDILDDQLIRVLAERFEITKAVGAYKAAEGLPAADPAREAEQVERLRSIATEVGMDPAFSEKVFRLVVDEVIRHHLRHSEDQPPKD